MSVVLRFSLFNEAGGGWIVRHWENKDCIVLSGLKEKNFAKHYCLLM